MNNDNTINDILSGKGLKPLSDSSNTSNNSSSNISGVSTEQRDLKSGVSYEYFTLNNKDDKK